MPQQQATSFGDDLARLRSEFEADLARVRQQSRVEVQSPQAQSPSTGITSQLTEGATRMGAQVVRNTVDPVRELTGAVWEATKDPFGAAKRGAEFAANMFKGLGQTQGAQFQKAREAANAGDYDAAVMHGAAYLLPVVGPMLDDMVQRVKAGQGPEVAGDLFTMFVLPGLAKKSPTIRTPNLNRLNTQASESMQFGIERGVPITAGEATGNPLLNVASQGAERATFAGSHAGMRRMGQVESRLTSIGEELASKAYPTPQTMATAGRSVRRGAEQRASSQAQLADDAYTRLRKIESMDPAAFAVDVSAAQQKLKPIYEQLKRESELVPLQGARADALVSLDRVMSAPNTVSLSDADRALGDLKRILRRQGTSEAGTRELQQVVSALDAQVIGAASANPSALRSLKEGRSATVGRHRAMEFVDQLRDEPVASARVAAKDANVAFLQEVSQMSPSSLPQIGRAFLDELLDTATSGGGFQNAKSVLNTWRKVGPEARQLLFADAIKKNPSYLKDLDNFFTLAERATRNANPSGSAWVGGSMAHLLTLATLREPGLSAAIEAAGYTASKLLSNPTVVRILARSASLPTSAVAARAANVAALYKALGLATAPAQAQGVGPARFGGGR